MQSFLMLFSGKDGASLRAPCYNILPGDLSQLPKELGELLLDGSEALLDRTCDTLFLAECVFIYLDPSVSNSIVRWCCSSFPSSMIVLYDPIGFKDAFGQMMISNLRVCCFDFTQTDINDPFSGVG
jgi:[phosphatase 2A protein]-leucine-carboxy methyltransferase